MNEGDPYLKAAADTELYDLEMRAIQIDIDKHNCNKEASRLYAELLLCVCWHSEHI